MKIMLKGIIVGLLSIQMLALPVVTVECIAAPGDGAPSPQSGAVKAPQGGARTETAGSGYGSPQDTYFTDSLGNILMYVNVWGAVHRPGQYTISEGSDISTALTLAGGPTEAANLEKVRVNRQSPDESGKQTYKVNLKKYAKEGDRAVLVDLKPNDTIIIPEDKGIDRGTLLSIIGIAVSIVSIIVWTKN